MQADTACSEIKTSNFFIVNFTSYHNIMVLCPYTMLCHEIIIRTIRIIIYIIILQSVLSLSYMFGILKVTSLPNNSYSCYIIICKVIITVSAQFLFEPEFLNNRKVCIGGNSTVVVCVTTHLYVAIHPPVGSPTAHVSYKYTR